jgi:hypothetical protein
MLRRRAASAMRADRAARQAGETALEANWRWIENSAGDLDLGLSDIAAAAAELGRQVTFLKLMGNDPAHHRRATALQAEMRAASTRRLDLAVQERMVAPLQGLATACVITDAATVQLESDGRALRRFDYEIKRLGAGSSRCLGPAIAALAPCAALTPIDRARMTEILLGPQSPKPAPQNRPA